MWRTRHNTNEVGNASIFQFRIIPPWLDVSIFRFSLVAPKSRNRNSPKVITRKLKEKLLHWKRVIDYINRINVLFVHSRVFICAKLWDDFWMKTLFFIYLYIFPLHLIMFVFVFVVGEITCLCFKSGLCWLFTIMRQIICFNSHKQILRHLSPANNSGMWTTVYIWKHIISAIINYSLIRKE